MSGQPSNEQERGEKEKDSTQIDQIRTNVFEGVSAAEDAHQVVVSTCGDLVSARNVTVGARSTQWLGQVSDTTLHQFSRDRGPIGVERTQSPNHEMVEKFENKYGSGYKLEFCG
jgi:hypothetical protein